MLHTWFADMISSFTKPNILELAKAVLQFHIQDFLLEKKKNQRYPTTCKKIRAFDNHAMHAITKRAIGTSYSQHKGEVITPTIK